MMKSRLGRNRKGSNTSRPREEIGSCWRDSIRWEGKRKGAADAKTQANRIHGAFSDPYPRANVPETRAQVRYIHEKKMLRQAKWRPRTELGMRSPIQPTQYGPVKLELTAAATKKKT